jgi:8-amino-7-oxononanoate synthase
MVALVPTSLDDELQAEMVLLEAQGRSRSCPSCFGHSRTTPMVDGQQLLSFCSNDYLGLSCHPALASAAADAIKRSGFGASASRLVSGDLPEHRELEAAIADFLDLEAALLFPTGYQTNLGVLTALAGPGDLLLCDHANHASILDACRLSRARPAYYRHLDLLHLEKKLVSLAPASRRIFIVTESLFGMDGDIAPLADLSTLAKNHGAALVVDEAHALGVQGPGGRGLCREAGVTPHVLIGTLGKAFGAAGGFAAGSLILRRYLVNRSRPFIFTTALPPPVAAAARSALKIIQGHEGQTLRLTLSSLVLKFASELPPRALRKPLTHIFPVVLGQDLAAVHASLSLRASGFFVQPIRPPTVPEGTARLRITISAAHSAKDVHSLAQALLPLIPNDT